jgi:D-amino peptidase
MKNLKIFISADMEGITGIIDWDEITSNKPDYQYFRKIMTDEVNAAIEGVLEKGATDIIVRDAHDSARNIIPDRLNEQARLLRAWTCGPYGMMEGINESFSAVICIGYHAKAMTSRGTLAHTMYDYFLDLRINNVSIPELGWNALIAGYHNVPVIFVSGDDIICDQSKKLIPEIETVAVKQGLGEANLNLHPQKANQLIKDGVVRALDRLGEFRPLIWKPPFTIELDYKKKKLANRAAWYPKAVRKGEFTVLFTCDDFLECMRFFYLAH